MMKKYFAVLMIFVLVMGISTGAMAAGNKKESILSEMDAAAAELGVQNFCDLPECLYICGKL